MIKNISKDSFEFRSCGAIARIISLGGKVTNKEHEVLNKNLKSLKLLAEKQVSQEEQHQIVSKQNVQQNIKEKFQTQSILLIVRLMSLFFAKTINYF